MTMAVGMMIVSMAGSIIQGMQQAKAAKANARVMEQNADAARMRGEEEASIRERQRARSLGTTKATYAARGLLVSDGAPLDVIEENFYLATRDIQMTRLNSELEALELRNQASIERSKGKSAITGSLFKAGTTLLGSGAFGGAAPAASTAGSSAGRSLSTFGSSTFNTSYSGGAFRFG